MKFRLFFCSLLLVCFTASVSAAPADSTSKGKAKNVKKEEAAVAIEEPSPFSKRIQTLLASLKTPPEKTEKEDRTPIFGQAQVPPAQIVSYILQRNPQPKLNCTVAELVGYYYEEASREGIRPDLAISQAILETDCFRYGGDVVPEQNNYAGIGTTGGGVKGAFFDSPQIGVRAQIQHLLGYASPRTPTLAVVDPRYDLLKALPDKFGRCSNWEDLNGRWAVPGKNYAQNIFRTLSYIKTAPPQPTVPQPPVTAWRVTAPSVETPAAAAPALLPSPGITSQDANAAAE
nr:glucosaminidase domain-containing protein [uncultured Anaeromusa sp.]